MLALLGLALSQVIGTPPCPNGRLVREVPIPRYSPWCCAGESYVWFDDLASAHIEEMMGKYVTVAPQSDTSLEFPTPAYLIDNDMTLEFRNDGNRTWENETAGTLHPYLYLAYSSYPIDYPPNEPATANTYYSIGANRDQATPTTRTRTRTGRRSSGSTRTSAPSHRPRRRRRPPSPCATRATGRCT